MNRTELMVRHTDLLFREGQGGPRYGILAKERLDQGSTDTEWIPIDRCRVSFTSDYVIFGNRAPQAQKVIIDRFKKIFFIFCVDIQQDLAIVYSVEERRIVKISCDTLARENFNILDGNVKAHLEILE